MLKGLARNGIWVALDNVSAAVLAFLFFVMTARILTPEQFGVAALVISVAQILQPMIDSLFHDAIVQRKAVTKSDLTTATTVCLAWSVCLAALLWLLSPWIAFMLSAPSMQTYLPWTGLSLIFGGLSAVAGAEARRNMQFRWLAIRTMVGRTLGMAIGFWMAWQGYGVWSVVLQFIVSGGISACLLLAATGLHIGRVRWTALKPLLAFAAPTMGTQLLLFANSRIVTLIVGGILGPIAAGTWSIAFRFVEPLQALMATTIGQLSLPVFSRQQTDRNTIIVYFSLGTRYLSMLLAPAFLGLAVCAKQVITVFVGEKWLDALPIMQVVCIVTMLLLMRQLAEIALTSRGRPGYTFVTHMLGSALSIFGVYLGVFFGLLPAAIGWSARAIPFLTINPFFIYKELGISMREQFVQIAFPIGAGLLMCIILDKLDLQHRIGLSPLGALLAMVIVGTVAYVGILSAIDGELRKLIGNRLRRLYTSATS